MKFRINAYQHFYLKGPNFQEIWKSLKIFTFKKSAITFAQGCITLCMTLYSHFIDLPTHNVLDLLQWSRSPLTLSTLIARFMGTNMGPTWVLSAPDWPHVDRMNLAIRRVPWPCQVTGCCQPYFMTMIASIVLLPTRYVMESHDAHELKKIMSGALLTQNKHFHCFA